MIQKFDEQIIQVRQAIAEMEARRLALGNEVVEPALALLGLRLDELLRLRQASEALPPPAPEEQRKLVSVLCADLAGFTSLSSQLDPEELREVQKAFFAAVTAPIRERGGLVEKYIGDAVLAVFGLPVAHENDPERQQFSIRVFVPQAPVPRWCGMDGNPHLKFKNFRP